MQRLVRFMMIGSVVFLGACTNGTRKGFDTMGAGATPGEAGGAPRPAMSAAGSVAPPTVAPDTAKKTGKKS
jgi:hypothetical protein